MVAIAAVAGCGDDDSSDAQQKAPGAPRAGPRDARVTSPPVAGRDPIQGELQEQIMKVLWRLKEARVEEVRQALPKSQRGAYTTVQTVLNRLAERRLLRRERKGNVILYSPRVSEAEYFSGSLQRALSGASDEARRVAIAQLVGGLDGGELREVQRLAEGISRRRGKP